MDQVPFHFVVPILSSISLEIKKLKQTLSLF